MPPLAFIPLAEETGMIVPIGDLVMRSACRFGNLLRKRHKKDLRIAVNVSAKQLMQDDFCIEFVVFYEKKTIRQN